MLSSRSIHHNSMPNSYFDRPQGRVSRPSYQSERMRKPASPPVLTMSRKRPRADRNSYSIDSFTVHSPTTDLCASVSSIDCLSPAPLANTDYFLSGGVDTPGAWNHQKEEYMETLEAEQDHRWNRFVQQTQESTPSRGHDQNRQQLMRRNETQSISGWHLRKVAWAMTGGLAGKIFNFCWNTTFRGFSAGGGQAYTADAKSATNHTRRSSEQYDSGSQRARPSLVSTKHRRSATEGSAIKNNWVFVERAETVERDQSPARKKSRASMAGSSRHKLGYGEEAHASNTASFASPRSGSSVTTPTYLSSYQSMSPSHKRLRPSLASPTQRLSSQSDLATVTSLHSSPEVEAYKRQKRRETRKQDESLRRLNAQLQGMIREGRQALGSKIEVIDSRDDFDIDEACFVDDDVH